MDHKVESTHSQVRKRSGLARITPRMWSSIVIEAFSRGMCRGELHWPPHSLFAVPRGLTHGSVE